MSQENIFTKFFHLIDIFGQITEFRIDQKPKFKTLSGGICTLIYGGFILLLFFSFGGAMINRVDPDTNVSQIFQESPSPSFISKNDYFFAFGLQDSTASHLIDEEIYTTLLNFKSKNQTTGNMDVFKIPLEPCTEENLPSEAKLNAYFHHQSNELKDLYCISTEIKEKFLIQGSWDQKVFDTLEIFVAPCKRSEKVCKPDEEIKTKLKSSFFAFYSIDNLFDLRDYNQPAKAIGRDYFTETSYTLKKLITRYLKTNQILSDDGWITESNTQQEFFSFDYDKESFEILENFDYLIQFSIRKSNYESIWNRKYKKISNVLAEMNGFLNIIFLGLFFLSNPFIKKEYYEFLTNNIYNFELDEEEIQKLKDRKKKKKITMDKGEKIKTLKTMLTENEIVGIERNKEFKPKASPKRTLSIKKRKNEDKLMNYFFKLKETPLNLTMFQHFKSFFLRNPDLEMKKNQRKTGISNIFSQLDLKFILKKFSEIDKLKMLLLDQDQYHLFEYLPKPVIMKNSKIHMNYVKAQQNISIKLDSKTDIIHQNDPLKKAKIVQKAFDNIMKKENMNDIDKKLIESLDQDIIKLLEGVHIEGREENKQNLFSLQREEQKEIIDNDFISLDRERESIFSEKREKIHTLYLEDIQY